MLTGLAAIPEIGKQHLMRRSFVVEAEAATLMANRVASARQFDPFELWRSGSGVCQRWWQISRQQRIGGKGVFDVGQQQFLMLLLVLEAKLDDINDFRRGGGEQASHGRIDVAL